MSELMNVPVGREDFRWRLLATVSALALAAGAICPKAAEASDKPSVWIELGGQLERIDGGWEPFLPPFTRLPLAPYSPISPTQAQKPPRNSYAGEGTVSFEPGNSGWIFSAAVRYGRSNNNKHVHQQTAITTPNPLATLVPTQPIFSYAQFADFKTKNREAHAVVDFMVGRDVGLGLFGRESSAQFNAGVRFAQFSSSSDVKILARPDVQFVPYPFTFFPGKYYLVPTHHDFIASASNRQSFHGVGPSVSFDASTPLFGNAEAGSIGIDWGVNAAVLFGRQKSRGEHATEARHFDKGYATPTQSTSPPPTYEHGGAHNRSRSVVVPNVGGFAGFSFHYPGTKISFGYRADFFFGAMDAGIDARHTVDRNFYGPYASISIGLGG